MEQMILNKAMMSQGNTYQGLRIRVLERRDIENARLLHNDASVLFQLTDIRFISELEQEAWFESISKSKTSRRYVIERAEDNEFVGLFRLDHIDYQNRNAMVGLDITPGMRGKGFSKIVYQWAFHYLFDQLGLHRLALETLASNTIAIALYRGLGFQEEGRLRQAIWRNGQYVDLLRFGLIQKDLIK